MILRIVILLSVQYFVSGQNSAGDPEAKFYDYGQQNPQENGAAYGQNPMYYDAPQQPWDMYPGQQQPQMYPEQQQPQMYPGQQQPQMYPEQDSFLAKQSVYQGPVPANQPEGFQNQMYSEQSQIYPQDPPPQMYPEQPQMYPGGQPQMYPEQPQMYPGGQPQMYPEQTQMYPGGQPQMYPEQPQMYLEQPQMYPGGQPQMYLEQPELYPGQYQPAQSGMYPGQDMSGGQPANDWYIPPGALPGGFDLNQETGGPIQQQPNQLQPDVNGQQQSSEWNSYIPTGWYPPNGQEQAYDDGWYDYNNYYLGGPCMEPPMEWDDGCGGDNTVPFCDEATCTRSCYQFMGYDRGVCLQNECFCRKSSNQQPPAPEQDWNYDTQSDWPTKYPECGLPNQSPVSLSQSRDLTRKVRLKNYDTPIGMFVENTGHGVRVYVQSKKSLPSLILSGVDNKDDNWSGEFVLGNIDLHWDTSEHAINERRADVEMQLNHFDLSFDSYEEASKVPGATVALAVLFNRHDGNETNLCKAITGAVAKVTQPGGPGANLMAMPHLKFLSQQLGSDFYLYSGTQTQPPCHKTNWIVAKTQFRVNEQQIKDLQSIHDVKNQPILRNVRRNHSS